MATITERHGARGVSYRAEVRLKGSDGVVIRKVKTWPTKTAAKAWIQETETDIRQGRITRSADVRWHVLVAAYIDHHEGLLKLKGEAERRNRRTMLRWWMKRIGKLKVSETTPLAIDTHLRALRRRGLSGKPVGPGTHNRYLSALSAAYRWAERRYGLRRRDNPTSGLRAKEPKGSDRWLTDTERELLLFEVRATGNQDLELLVRLGLTTGHRRGPLVDLRWSQLDRTTGEIRLKKDDTKAGEALVLPIASTVSELLDQRVRRFDSDYILQPGPKGVPAFPRKAWDRVRDRLYAQGVEPFVFHSLRHSAASYLAQAGWSLVRIASFLGHKSTASTQRYAHLVQSKTAHEGLAVLAERGVG